MSAVLEASPLTALADEVQAFRGEVAQAIDGLVTGVLDLQDGRIAPLDDRVRDIAARLHKLERTAVQLRGLDVEVRRVARELDLERACRSLAEMSRMAPKSRTVVFVGRWHFGDNLKYAWLEALRHAGDAGYECWYLPPDAQQQALVESLGAPCLPWSDRDWTPEHFLVAQRTAVLVVADHFFSAAYHPNPYAPALFAGARWLQLWHGISIKEVALRYPTALRGMSAFRAQSLASCGTFASFVGGSTAAEAEWRRWFSFERYRAVGYPRGDVLLREPNGRDLLNVDADALECARAARRAGGRTVLYVPTFRDKELGTWIYKAGLGELSDALAERGDQLLVNLHPLDQFEQAKLQARYPGVRFVREKSDLYPLLREVDAMVTDYSSLMFDYLPLARPMLFYRPDHQSYVDESRPLYDAKVRALPGATCVSLPELVAALQGDLAALDAPYVAVREELTARLFDRIDDRASERVAQLIEEELELALAARG
jgi:CDP-glycerol glycerophosphotransferase